MRCPDCQKFVSFDTDREPEDLNVEVDDDGVVTGTVRIVNACQECGTELTEANLDVEVDLSSLVSEHRDEVKEEYDAEQAKLPEDERVPFDEKAHDLCTVESSEAVREDRRQMVDAKGKPIKPRYQKQFYGASVTVTIACKCGETFSQTDTCETQASSMESLV